MTLATNRDMSFNCSILYLFPDYGDVELVDYFRPGLIDAGVDVGLIEMEWNKLKHSILTR